MKTPVFLVYGNDLVVFESVEGAAAYAEPIDAENREFVAYDADGKVLAVGWEPGRVYLSASDENPPEPGRLKKAIRNALSDAGDPAGQDPDLDLATLVEAYRKYGYEKQSRAGDRAYALAVVAVLCGLVAAFCFFIAFVIAAGTAGPDTNPDRTPAYWFLLGGAGATLGLVLAAAFRSK